MESPTPEEMTPEVDDVATVRELILRTHTDVVPELVAGATIADLTASIEPARAAYQRITEGVRELPPAVPAGGAPMVVDLDRLPTAELIRRGVEQRSR